MIDIVRVWKACRKRNLDREKVGGRRNKLEEGEGESWREGRLEGEK